MTEFAEEIFDVVDTNDRVIEQRARSEVHRLRLLHRAIHVFLFRPDGSMLIHKRSPHKEEFPSVWTSSCSGHLSAGESYDEAAPRELFEELGIRSRLSRLMKFSACEDTSLEFTMLYAARGINAELVRPDSDEMTEIRWMTVDEIRRWMLRAPEDFSPAFRLLFSWFVDQHRSGQQ